MTTSRKMAIIAQDPSVKRADGSPLWAEVEVPDEGLAPGLRGCRLPVIDCNASQRVLCLPYDSGATDAVLKSPAELVPSGPVFDTRNAHALIDALGYGTISHSTRRSGRSTADKFPCLA